MSTIAILVCIWPGVVLGLGYAAMRRIMKHNDSPTVKVERELKAQGLENLKHNKEGLCNSETRTR